MLKIFALLFSFISVGAFNFQGATKPLGYFDPFGFSKGASDNQLVRLREAELKHGRWGMVSALAIPIQESVTHTPSIHNYDLLPETTQGLLLWAITMAEFSYMLRGWENPFVGTNNFFKVKADYQPGDLGFRLKDSMISDDLMNKELNNGRLAMIASLGMIVQELVTNKSIL
jgi:light-harvesting complex I chlorophyll a/b binding protein 1